MTALAQVADLLRCPRCQLPVILDDRRLVCASGHSYDVARQGYVNLLGSTAPGFADTAAMVTARSTFLGAGHYDPIIDAIPIDPATEVIIDVGAGPGYQLSRVLDRAPSARGLAVDVSAVACRRAARSHRRAASVVADVWRSLPLGDHVADLIMVVFAPRNFAEFARVLRPGGRVVVVTPEPDHLHELVHALDLMTVEQDKTERLRRGAEEWFDVIDQEAVRRTVRLNRDELRAVVLMGPNAFHLGGTAVDPALDRLANSDVSVSCLITELRRHPG